MAKPLAAFAFIACAGALTAVSAGAQTYHSNTQKYRERNPSAATGRSGSASLQARLLLDKAGGTDVEVTTGALDSPATPPGSITKVQLKAFDALGETIFTLNYGPLSGGGYWTESFDTFAPGQPFQVQGNIRGVDGRRSDVVVVTGSVQKRPDLSVRNLQAPERVSVNLPVQIVATVAELNGHVGARADCLLFVDDVEADRNTGIWVDSADSVSCAFAQTFDTPGARQLRVDVINVQPGDWDTANNSVTGSIDVVTPTQNYQYAFASATRYDEYDYSYKHEGRYLTSSTTGYDWVDEYTYEYSGFDQFYYWGERWDLAAAPTTWALSIHATDGNTTWAAAPPVSGCAASGQQTINGRLVWWYYQACGGYAYVSLSSAAGTVTYMSRYWRRFFRLDGTTEIADPPTEYFYNSSADYGSGRLTGTTLTIDAALTVDGTTYSTPLDVSMNQPFSVNYNDYNCYTSTQWNYCSTYVYTYSGVSGYAWQTAP